MEEKKHWYDGRIPEGMTLLPDEYRGASKEWKETYGFVAIQDLSITDWDDYLKKCIENLIDYPFELMKEHIGDAVLKYCPNEENFRNCYKASKNVAEQGVFLDPSNVILKILDESYGTDSKWFLTGAFMMLKDYDMAYSELFSADRENFAEREKNFRSKSFGKRQSARILAKTYIKDLPKNYDAIRDYELRFKTPEEDILIAEARVNMVDREIGDKYKALAEAQLRMQSAEEDYDREDEYWSTPSQSKSLDDCNRYGEECKKLEDQISELNKEREMVFAAYSQLLEKSGGTQVKKNVGDDPVSI